MVRVQTQRKNRPSGKVVATLVAAAGSATAAASPLIRRLMVRGGIVDNPNARSSHDVPVPRGGGWACLVGLACGCAAARMAGQPLPLRTTAGVGTLALVGFADDRWNVPALPRLAAQVGVGLATDLVSRRIPVGAAVVPAVVNVVNFMDGINGMTALTTAVWGTNAAIVGTRSANGHLTILGAALAGSALGFLPHNLRLERMFLGDIGSYLIGATMALTALHPSLSWRARAAVLAPLGPYLTDTGATLIRRARRGENLMEAHREHLYQKLANEREFGHVPTASLYAAAAALMALIVQIIGWEA